MPLTKETKVDQITVNENGVILYRELTRILEDGEELSVKYHRYSLSPGHDLTGIPEVVVSICNVVWTTDMIEAYQSKQS